MMEQGTANDMMRLQTYGSFYVSGVDPVMIEQTYIAPSMQLNNLEAQIGNIAGQAATGMQTAADAVQIAMNFAGSAASIAGAAAGGAGIGAAVGAVASVVGVIISSVLRNRATIECDESKCLEEGGLRFNETNHRRAIIGIDPPPGADKWSPSSCLIAHWGGTKSICKARWGYFAEYMNDGSWVYKIPQGTVIGVQARIKNDRIDPWCNEDKYCTPFFPFHTGMKQCERPGPEPTVWAMSTYSRKNRNYAVPCSHMPAGIQRREKAVTQVLEWMQKKMPYSILSCFNRMIYHLQAGSDYVVCGTYAPQHNCNEQKAAPYLNTADGVKRHNFGGAKGIYARLALSRVYASIRGQFAALVKMSKELGTTETIKIFGQSDIKANGASTALMRILRGETSSWAWPEKPLADVMTYVQLRRTLKAMAAKIIDNRVADEVVLRSTGTMTARAPYSESSWKKRLSAMRRWNLTTTHYVLIGGGILVLGGAIAYATKGGK